MLHSMANAVFQQNAMTDYGNFIGSTFGIENQAYILRMPDNKMKRAKHGKIVLQ